MIILRNAGEIDIAVIKTMGVNVKESDSAIGYFGTGLKYAIAVFLREGIDLQLWIGRNQYEFYVEPTVIRGKEFALCKMRGPYDSVDLGFTTGLGKNWDLWQAYREIHSNCLDENGEIYNGTVTRGDEGFTTFALADIDTSGIFLHQMDNELLHKAEGVEIYKGESDWIYYRGIRAKHLDMPSIYTYNVLSECTLTEDRLICYDHQVEYAINNAAASMRDKGMIKDLVTAPRGSFESTLSMHYYTKSQPSEEFKEVVNAYSKTASYGARQYLKAHTPAPEPTRREKKNDLMSQLEDFCASFGLDHEIDGDRIVITGDLLNEDEAN